MTEIHDLGKLPEGPRVFQASKLGMKPGFWPEMLQADGKLWKRERLDEDGAKYAHVNGYVKMLIANN